MNEMQLFKNNEFGEIRTLEESGKILFCGSDIAKALGYAKPQNAIATHCKGCTLKQGIPHPQSPEKTIEMSFIPEGDVYRLITHSKLQSAEKFETWVFDEVLPTIRRNGIYATDELLDNPDLIIEIATKLKQERAINRVLHTENAQQKQMLNEFTPKASYYDVVLQTTDVLSISKIAKDYGKSAMWLNAKLHDLGIQFKQGGVWLLYQKHAEQGYTKSKTETYSGSDGNQHGKIHTYWTQKGRLFIYDLLKHNGIFPVIEQSKPKKLV